MRYDATKKEDVARLAMNFATTPSADYWKVLGHVYDLGLMRFRGIVSPLVWLLRKVRGTAGVLGLFYILHTKRPDWTKEMMLETIEHMLTGKDHTDPLSFGGWSQREIDALTSRVTFSNDAAERSVASC